jgi:FtsH-binding integral membrane protein
MIVVSAALVTLPAGRAVLYLILNRDPARTGDIATQTLCLYYACCVAALVALFFLNRLLANIKKDAVFTEENVQALRAISWCCFAEAFILTATALYFAPILLAFAAGVAFFGLILRVVKNVINAAVALKAENDFTI